ncbi:MAG: sugar phosphate isomerase/epimerase [Lentisphaerae bacterium]|nr:sugar phosphate isomerase/epimerase [Lentisphaerota bacterium]
MKTALFSLPSPDMDFRHAVDYALQLGVDAIEPYPHAEFRTPSAEAAKRLADYAGERNVGICCFSMMGDLAADDLRSEIRRLKDYADVAAALGSRYFHHTLVPALSLTGRAGSYAATIRRAADAAREVFDYAGERGVQCIYEDQGFVVNGVERFGDFLGALDRDAGVVADLGNTFFVDETPEAFTRRFLPAIRHVHVKDYLVKDSSWPHPGDGWYLSSGGNYLRGTVIGHGRVDMTRVFSILNAGGYDGFYSMEFDGPEEAFRAQSQGLKNMRRFMDLAAGHSVPAPK